MCMCSCTLFSDHYASYGSFPPHGTSSTRLYSDSLSWFSIGKKVVGCTWYLVPGTCSHLHRGLEPSLFYHATPECDTGNPAETCDPQWLPHTETQDLYSYHNLQCSCVCQIEDELAAVSCAVARPQCHLDIHRILSAGVICTGK